jgi:hypothetical protein
MAPAPILGFIQSGLMEESLYQFNNLVGMTIIRGFASFHGNGFELLGAYYSPHAQSGCMVVKVMACVSISYQIFGGRANHHKTEVLVICLFPQAFPEDLLRFHPRLSPKMGGIPYLYLIVLNIQIYGFIRPPGYEDPGIISGIN